MVVRQALTGIADCLSLDALEANDLKTAVTEACNNVVLHAYGDAEGPLEVDVHVLGGTIDVVVRDHGKGIEARAHKRPPEGYAVHDSTASGMGLAVIDALARQVEFSEPPAGGTEVRVQFPVPGGATLEPITGPEFEDDEGSCVEHSTSRVALSVAPKRLARAVLPRVLSALAARAYFTTDRISDVQLVADVLAANVDESMYGSHLRVGVTVEPRTLELRIGPLSAGDSARLVVAAADGMAPVIDRLADFKRVEPTPTGEREMLELRLVDQH